MVASNMHHLENKYRSHYAEFPGRFSAIQTKADQNLQIYSDPMYKEYLRQQQSGLLKSEPHHYDIPIETTKNKLILTSSVPIVQNTQIKPNETHYFVQTNSNIQMTPQISSQKLLNSSKETKLEQNQFSLEPNENSNNATPKNVVEIFREQSV